MDTFFCAIYGIGACTPEAENDDCLGDETSTAVDDEGCVGDDFDITAVDLSTPQYVPDDGSLTETEQLVQEIIRQDGIHVVHFWAPWCDNSISEFRKGWYELIERNEEATFTFVTIWNNNQMGEESLEKYAIPDRVFTFSQPDFGPSDDRSQRRNTFINFPVTWIPSTWIFHKNGELAFALNYGEMEMNTIQQLMDTVDTEW